jgi:hypothetical protein
MISARFLVDFTPREKPSMRINWPNFFIVGAANSGTTSLYTYLNQHPEVFLPALKEPHYFSQIRPAYEQRYMRPYVTDETAYLQLFRKAGGYKAIGEASTSYLSDPEALRRIRDMVPNARIIIILRDPVERAHSHYLMDVREGRQNLPFFAALQDDWNRKDKGWGVSQLYVELGMYAEQVKRYLRAFGPEQVIILMFEELKGAAAKGALAKVLRLIDVDLSYLSQIDMCYVENSFGIARWSWTRHIAGSNLARRVGQSLVPMRMGSNHTIKRLIFQPYFVKPAPRPDIDPRARDWLISIFDPNIRELEGILGGKLPNLRRTWESSSSRPDRKCALAV